MENSATYLGIKVLLENGGLVMQYSEFVKLLTQLEMEALITGDEQKDLLEFAEPILRAYEKH